MWLPEELLGAEMIVKQAMDGAQAVNNLLATVPHDVETPMPNRVRAICGRAPFIKVSLSKQRAEGCHWFLHGGRFRRFLLLDTGFRQGLAERIDAGNSWAQQARNSSTTSELLTPPLYDPFSHREYSSMSSRRARAWSAGGALGPSPI